MKIEVTTHVEAPDDATHYFGELLEEPQWLKCTQVGVAGDHWWTWNMSRKCWTFLSHYKPHWAKEIPISKTA